MAWWRGGGVCGVGGGVSGVSGVNFYPSDLHGQYAYCWNPYALLITKMQAVLFQEEFLKTRFLIGPLKNLFGCKKIFFEKVCYK